MTNWDGLNRRRFPRIKYPCLVVIQNTSSAPEDVILTHTENIGVGGVCLILKKSIDMFSEVGLEIDLLDLGDHIKCKGKVVWNVKRKNEKEDKPHFYDIGLEYIDVTKKDKDRLENIIQRIVKNNKDSTIV